MLEQQAGGTEIYGYFGYGLGRVLWTNRLERETIDIMDTCLRGSVLWIDRQERAKSVDRAGYIKDNSRNA